MSDSLNNSSNKVTPRESFSAPMMEYGNKGGQKTPTSTKPGGSSENEEDSLNEAQEQFEIDEAQEQFLLDLLNGRKVRLMRDRWLDRLVMEETFCQNMMQCGIFALNFGFFLAMVFSSYPAGDIVPIHDSIVKHFELPMDVNNLADLREGLKTMADLSKFFSPGSSVYAEDHLAHSYLSKVTQVPPMIVVPKTEEPRLLPNMTLTCWVRSSARYDTIIERVRHVTNSGGTQNGGGHGGNKVETCWRFDLERIIYGEHEGEQRQQIVNPNAARIHRVGADQDLEWRTSSIRRQFATGTWHHFSVVIEGGLNIRFAADGVLGTVVHAQRPLTDCEGGVVHLGSASMTGELLGLKLYPRALSEPELRDDMSAGKPLGDLLASATAKVVNPSTLDQIHVWTGEKDTKTAEMFATLNGNNAQQLRHMSSLLIEEFGLIDDALGLDVEGSGSSSAHASSSSTSHRRQLKASLKAVVTRELAGAGVAVAGNAGNHTAIAAADIDFSDSAQCKDENELVCDDVMLFGTKIRLAAHFALQNTSYTSYCTKKIGLSQISYTEAECKELIGGFAGHAALNHAYAAADASHRVLAGAPVAGVSSSSSALDISADAAAFFYPTDCKFGKAMKCMQIPADVHSWVAKADALTNLNDGNNGTTTLVGTSNSDLFTGAVFSQSRYIPELGQNCSTVMSELTTLEKEYLEHKILGFFRLEEYYRCGHYGDFRDYCSKTCGECGLRDHAPTTSDVLEAVLDCADNVNFHDWASATCEWYALNDPGCDKYANAEVKANCRQTCGTCDEHATLMRAYDMNADTGLELNELNAFFVAIRQPEHRMTYHNYKSVVNYMCCKRVMGKSDPVLRSACDAVEHGAMLYYDAVQYLEVVFESRDEYQFANWMSARSSSNDDLRTVDGVALADFTWVKRREIVRNFIDPCVQQALNDESITFSLLEDSLGELIDDGLQRFLSLEAESRPYLKSTEAEAKLTQRFEQNLHSPSHLQTSMERSFFRFEECSEHIACEIPDYETSYEVYPHACSYEVDPNNTALLFAPKNCDPYAERSLMFCSHVCHTGACGHYGDIEWGASFSEINSAGSSSSHRSLGGAASNTQVGGHSGGWCQPCNGCDKYTSVDGNCPDHCLQQEAVVPEHTALVPHMVHNGNALGSWSLAMWVKEFDYQWIMRKQMHFTHDHPNQEWEGYTAQQIEIFNVDSYLEDVSCRHFDGIYEVVAPLASTGLLVHENGLAQLVFRHFGAYDYWMLISNDKDCVAGKKRVLVAAESSSSSENGAASGEFFVPSHAGSCVSSDSSSSASAGSSSGHRALAAYGAGVASNENERVVLSWRAVDREHPYQNPLHVEDALFGDELVSASLASIDYAGDVDVHAKVGDLICWRLDYNRLCFRNKWYERYMTCVENPFAQVLQGSAEWHHLAVVKKGEQWTEYDFGTDPPKPVWAQRVDHLEFFVDGKRADLLANLVPPFGLPDCGGPIRTEARIADATLDFYQGFQYEAYNEKKNTDAAAFPYAQQRAPAMLDSFRKYFPMGRALPLGGKETITAFTFEAVDIPRDIFVHSAKLDICGADLLANYMFEEYKCPETLPPVKEESIIEFDIYGLVNVTSLDKIKQAEDPCYLADLVHYQRSSAKIHWRIPTAQWKLNAVLSQEQGSTESEKRRAGAQDCTATSPDLTPIFEEILEQPGWEWGNGITMVIVETGKVDFEQCHPEVIQEELLSTEQMEAEIVGAADSCQMIEKLRRPLNAAFPLWVLPYEDQSHPSGGVARISMEWCLNEICVSPQFLGAGPDVEYGGYHAVSRLKEEHTAEDSDVAAGKLRRDDLNDEVCFSSIDGSEYDCKNRCPSQTYTKDWDIVGTFDCENKLHQAIFEDRKGQTKEHRMMMDTVAALEAAEEEKTGNQVSLLRRRLSSLSHGELVRQSKISKSRFPGSKFDPMPHVIGRKLAASGGQSSGNSDTSVTSLEVGELTLAGLPRLGQIYDARFVSRGLALSEIQRLFYSTKSVVMKLSGAEPLIQRPSPQTDLQIKLFGSEIVSAVPPVLFQKRAEPTSCKNQLPGLAYALDSYLHHQVALKCEHSYTCTYPQINAVSTSACELQSGYACLDHEKPVIADPSLPGYAPEKRYWDRNTVHIEGIGHAFPEFLDMMNSETMYRGGVMHEIDEWIDLQTTEIVMMNVFMAPQTRVSTVMRVEWIYQGPGKFHATYSLTSSKQLSVEEQGVWLLLAELHVATTILEVLMILFIFMQRKNFRKDWGRRLNIALMENQSERFRKDKMVLKRIDEKIKNNTPLMSASDVYDLAFRFVLVVFSMGHIAHYYSPDLEDTDVGRSEEPLQSILGIPWDNHDIKYEDKVDQFLGALTQIVDFQAEDTILRRFTYMLILAFFFRTIVFLKAHPRIAVLYQTVLIAGDDLMHFFLVVGLLLLQLAFIAFWNFGPEELQFGTFRQAAFGTVRMMVGNIPFGEYEHMHDFYFSFLVIFIILVIIILLNIARAILINAYAKVKVRQSIYRPESSLVRDVWLCCFYWPLVSYLRNWPSRYELILQLLDLEYKQNVIMTECENGDLLIDQHVLQSSGMFKSPDRGEAFLRYFKAINDKMDVHALEERDCLIEHESLMAQMKNLHGYTARLANESSTRDSSRGRGTTEARSRASGASDATGRTGNTDRTTGKSGNGQGGVGKTRTQATKNGIKRVQSGGLEINQVKSGLSGGSGMNRSIAVDSDPSGLGGIARRPSQENNIGKTARRPSQQNIGTIGQDDGNSLLVPKVKSNLSLGSAGSGSKKEATTTQIYRALMREITEMKKELNDYNNEANTAV